MVRCGKDKVVCNSKIEEVYNRLGADDKTLITYDEIDHSILQDGEYLPLVVRDITDWMRLR